MNLVMTPLYFLDKVRVESYWSLYLINFFIIF